MYSQFTSLKQAQIPTDHDGVVNRNNDIIFWPQSKEEEVLLLISDYVDLVRDLIKTAKDNGVKDNVINGLLNQQTNTMATLKTQTIQRNCWRKFWHR